jgi:Fe-S-cluster containining protein
MSPESAEVVEVQFELRIGEGKLKAKVEVPAGQTTVTQLLPIIQSLDNAIVSATIGEVSKAGLTISCKAGCGACCRQMVPVSIFEAQAMADWIRNLPEEQRGELEVRFHRVLLALRDSGMLKRLVEEDWFADDDTSLLMATDYFRLSQPCPFLENESCSIHAIRPLSCREYLVTSPSELCADPAKNGVAGVHLPLKMSRALFRMGGELEQDRRGWIPLVFLFAWMKSGADPGAAFGGTGQEVLYKVIQHLTTISPDREGTPS